jgi:hypothetical protein
MVKISGCKCKYELLYIKAFGECYDYIIKQRAGINPALL